MDSNKDEALRCVRTAEEAIASGNKDRALKFLKIAKRLNQDLSVDELFAACEKLGSGSNVPSGDEKDSVGNDDDKNKAGCAKINEGLSGEQSYAKEQLELVRNIRRDNDYYAILQLEKACSVEEIRRAYKKLSLKVHPDKNKAAGSDEAFKKVSKAFKCLSNSDLRRQYDQMGLVEEFEHKQQYNVKRPMRKRSVHNFYDDDFDPDEIFRSFFGRSDMFRAQHTYMSRGMGSQHRQDFHGGGSNLILLLQILPFLLILVLAYVPFSEPNYSLHKNYSYQILKKTEKHGIDFFVKSPAFDENFPLGSLARANIEDNVIKEYKNMLWRHCRIEAQRRHWNRNLPTPSCVKVQNLGLV
uniref:Uncharacterized protein MANES_03G196600 n=1 Tax=Rhizophora mucronata TaxID=61149 RepID=A0A2P2K323_RHIMU